MSLRVFYYRLRERIPSFSHYIDAYTDMKQIGIGIISIFTSFYGSNQLCITMRSPVVTALHTCMNEIRTSFWCSFLNPHLSSAVQSDYLIILRTLLRISDRMLQPYSFQERSHCVSQFHNDLQVRNSERTLLTVFRGATRGQVVKFVKGKCHAQIDTLQDLTLTVGVPNILDGVPPFLDPLAIFVGWSKAIVWNGVSFFWRRQAGKVTTCCDSFQCEVNTGHSSAVSGVCVCVERTNPSWRTNNYY